MKMDGVVFLLSQLGSHAAGRFADALRAHELTPPLAGMLRLLAAEQGLSQQALAERLGMAPSRVVTFVDDLERRGWVRRERGTVDRRVNVLRVTEEGAAALRTIGKAGMEHERALTKGLTEEECTQLRGLLGKLADAQGLTSGVHPGYGTLPAKPTRE